MQRATVMLRNTAPAAALRAPQTCTSPAQLSAEHPRVTVMLRRTVQGLEFLVQLMATSQAEWSAVLRQGDVILLQRVLAAA